MSPLLFMNYPLASCKFHWFVHFIQFVHFFKSGHFLNSVCEHRQIICACFFYLMTHVTEQFCGKQKFCKWMQNVCLADISGFYLHSQEKMNSKNTGKTEVLKCSWETVHKKVTNRNEEFCIWVDLASCLSASCSVLIHTSRHQNILQWFSVWDKNNKEALHEEIIIIT